MIKTLVSVLGASLTAIVAAIVIAFHAGDTWRTNQQRLASIESRLEELAKRDSWGRVEVYPSCELGSEKVR